MLLISVLSFIPIVIWIFMEPLGVRFSDINSITTSLGQIFGLVGMAMFSVNLILSGRLKILDKYFKGLDKVYQKHHNLGAIAFSIILFHPLFLVVKYLNVSLEVAMRFFTPFTNISITWGIISLLIMILLMILTFYVALKYHKWKLSHKFMTIAFIFAMLHTFMINSDVSRNNFLRYYILILAIAGLVISIKQTFLSKIFIKKTKYQIRKIIEINKDTVEIEMGPLNKKIDFIPGQFAFFSFYNNAISSESHPFSIASSNKEDNLRIIVKNFGDFTGELKRLKVGDMVLIDGPYGNFSYKQIDNKNQIWIAGGIGITPYLSMSKVVEEDYHIDLYYSIKDNNEAVRLGLLNDISSKNQNFKFRLWVTKEKGYITAKTILDLSNGLEAKDIFLCGPPAFMESLKNQFLAMGVDIKKIHYENFSF